MSARNENGPALFGAASGIERAIPLFVRAHAEVPSSFDLDLDAQCTWAVQAHKAPLTSAILRERVTFRLAPRRS